MATTEIQNNSLELHARGNGNSHLSAPPRPASLAPTSYAEMFKLAEQMFRSKMFGVANAEQAMVVLMTGLELGFGPAQSFRGIHVINNKPTLSADMMVAVCKSRPDVCHFFRLVESTDERATYATCRVGEPEPTQITFAIKDAERAGLLGNPTWKKFPSQMLRARAASGLARAVYSDLILGLYTEDEAEHISAPRRDALNAVPVASAPDEMEDPEERRRLGAEVSALAEGLTPTQWETVKVRVQERGGMRLMPMPDLYAVRDMIDAMWQENADTKPENADTKPAKTEDEDDPFADTADAKEAAK